MEDKYIIEPDTRFIKEVIELGGESLKKCFQCSTCTVVCSLSPGDKPFPRKEMIWAQWGLKDRLLKDVDVWLCHQCTDCSTNCPRSAKPGNVLAAIRDYSMMHIALPGFLSKFITKYIYLLVILPVLLFLWVLPLSYAPISFTIVGILALIAILMGMWRFWGNISRSGSTQNPVSRTKKGFLASFFSAVGDILLHNKFQQCESNKSSRLPHLLVMYGVILLVISHFTDQLYPIAGIGLSPAPLTDPFKIIGNIGALGILIGLTIIIYRRLLRKDEVGDAIYFDWVFLVFAYVITITGFTTELFRFAGAITLLHWSYLIHLSFLFALLAYAPFSKLTHMLYRTLAMTYAKQIGREV